MEDSQAKKQYLDYANSFAINKLVLNLQYNFSRETESLKNYRKFMVMPQC